MRIAPFCCHCTNSTITAKFKKNIINVKTIFYYSNSSSSSKPSGTNYKYASTFLTFKYSIGFISRNDETNEFIPASIIMNGTYSLKSLDNRKVVNYPANITAKGANAAAGINYVDIAGFFKVEWPRGTKNYDLSTPSTFSLYINNEKIKDNISLNDFSSTKQYIIDTDRYHISLIKELNWVEYAVF